MLCSGLVNGMRIWRPSLFLLMLLVYCDTPMLLQTTGAAEDEIHSVMAQIRIASLEGETDKVGNLLTDEYVQTDISGHVQDKQTWLREYFNPLAELIKSRKFHWDTFNRRTSSFGFMAHRPSSSASSKQEGPAQNGCQRTTHGQPIQAQALVAPFGSRTSM